MDHGADSYRRFLDGDDSAMVELIRDYKDGLMFFLNRYVNNIYVAEELTEDTFFRLVTRKPRFAAGSSFKTWLYTIGRNLALNHLRYARRFAEMDLEDLADRKKEEESVERAFLREEERLQLSKALSRLPQNYAAVLHLRYFEDMDNQQVAGVMKKSKRQVENLLYQGKRALKLELEREGFIYEGLS